MRLLSIATLAGSVLAGLSPPAIADAPRPTPFTVTAGLGIAMSDIFEDDYRSSAEQSHSFTWGPALRVEVAYHVHPNIAVGVHLGLARVDGLSTERRSMFNVDHEYTYSSFEGGIAAQLSFDRFWVAPWVGANQLEESEGLNGWVTEASLAAGVGIGGTVYRNQMHRIDLFASAMRSVKSDPDYYGVGSGREYTESFLSFSGGVAYRY